MCPLRFILVFFSAVLAGYFAWRSFCVSPEIDAAIISEASPAGKAALQNNERDRNLKTMIQDGFWVFVDMATGRYLWRNLQEMKKDVKSRSC